MIIGWCMMNLEAEIVAIKQVLQEEEEENIFKRRKYISLGEALERELNCGAGVIGYSGGGVEGEERLGREDGGGTAEET